MNAKGRRKQGRSYKYALVKWDKYIGGWEDYPEFSVEHKDLLAQWWTESHTVLCDDQPYKVLKGMCKLLQEPKKD